MIVSTLKRTKCRILSIEYREPNPGFPVVISCKFDKLNRNLTPQIMRKHLLQPCATCR